MGELRALVADLSRAATVSATEAATQTEAPATAPETFVPPSPATAPETPATATQYPPPITQYPEEKEGIQTQRAKRAAPPAAPEGVDVKVWADWLALRKAKKAVVTSTAVDSIRAEAGKAGLTLQEALETCCRQGWAAVWRRSAVSAQSTFVLRPIDF
ncbi:hypothetical protein [Sphaerotilus sp.]|uniref:hypothetical protein n=1 Tax=Sphaerotilus sp. TaxID=2093942 RepID=UPI0025CF2AA7|nr:hypothetical protein [Sphaerotilus sp.]